MSFLYALVTPAWRVGGGLGRARLVQRFFLLAIPVAAPPALRAGPPNQVPAQNPASAAHEAAHEAAPGVQGSTAVNFIDALLALLLPTRKPSPGTGGAPTGPKRKKENPKQLLPDEIAELDSATVCNHLTNRESVGKCLATLRVDVCEDEGGHNEAPKEVRGIYASLGRTSTQVGFTYVLYYKTSEGFAALPGAPDELICTHDLRPEDAIGWAYTTDMPTKK